VLNPFLLRVRYATSFSPRSAHTDTAFAGAVSGCKTAPYLARFGIHCSYPSQQSEKAHFNHRASDAVCSAYDEKRSHFPTLTFGQGAY
jgi:hypothetical protein